MGQPDEHFDDMMRNIERRIEAKRIGDHVEHAAREIRREFDLLNHSGNEYFLTMNSPFIKERPYSTIIYFLRMAAQKRVFSEELFSQILPAYPPMSASRFVAVLHKARLIRRSWPVLNVSTLQISIDIRGYLRGMLRAGYVVVGDIRSHLQVLSFADQLAESLPASANTQSRNAGLEPSLNALLGGSINHVGRSIDQATNSVDHVLSVLGPPPGYVPSSISAGVK